MKRTWTHTAIGFGIVAFGITLALSKAEPLQQPKAELKPAWEYRVLLLTDVVDVRTALKDGPGKVAESLETKFNALGSEGWKYAGEINGGMIFERRKP